MILPSNCSGSHCNSVIICLNLFENAQSSESWEKFPLELDSIQIIEITIFQIPCNFILPGFDWLVTKTSQTQHRVGEDMGLGIRNLNRLVTW